MKKTSKFFFLTFFLVYITTFSGCKKEPDNIINENENEPAIGPEISILTTILPGMITPTTAAIFGNISSTGGTEVKDRGVCWSTTPRPTLTDNLTSEGTGSGTFTSYLTRLIPNMIYYARTYAINSVGTTFGNEVSFATLPIYPINFDPDLTYGIVSDIDGNVYRTIQIGTQLWMAENLKTTKFNDGIPIPNVTDSLEWESLSTPGYCWYDNNEVYKRTYGALYNWYAGKTDKLCPTGWHVPSNDEWNTLIAYLGGEIAAGVKVIETGDTHWLWNIPGATNETGFTGLPGGSRSAFNDFKGFVALGYFGHWWTTTDYTPPFDALVTQLPSMNDNTGQLDFEAGFAAKKFGGVSVRCVKD